MKTTEHFIVRCGANASKTLVGDVVLSKSDDWLLLTLLGTSESGKLVNEYLREKAMK